ncbi:unnamed protein product [Linum tenue]|uniref:HXXXD-type acyl-transferase family protein n=2 Tax=Linum tenue TaxID=586396 RepID=A0AAV0JE19_9ROSI|nr:unnamed protein product [Linum tenue]
MASSTSDPRTPDARVRILSTEIIHAKNTQSPLERIPLTACDLIPLTACDLRLILVRTIQNGLLFRNPTDHHPISRQAFIENLKSAFSKALALHHPFAGRLTADEHPDGSATVYIDCNDAGCPFLHAVADGITVDEALNQPFPVPPAPVLWSFFPSNDVKNYHGFIRPLMSIQITELVDGVFIGWTINHAVADGTTHWNFHRIWSSICRGSGDHSPPVFTRDSSLEAIKKKIRVPWSRIRDFNEDNLVIPPLKEGTFHFSKKKIAELKAKGTAELSGSRQISSLQILIAHLWRAVIRSRADPDPESETRFGIQVGFRGRFEPNKFPAHYFGNAIGGRTVTMKVKDLVAEGSLGRVAAEVNRVVAETTDEKLREAVEDWIESPDMRGLGEFTEGALMLSGSPRFDAYGTDFGWGKAVAVRSGWANKCDGKVTVFPGPETGSMGFEICLSPECFDRLRMDSEFMAAVTE